MIPQALLFAIGCARPLPGPELVPAPAPALDEPRRGAPLLRPAVAALPLPDETSVLINELMADNESVFSDPRGDFDDWVELVNTGETAVDLSGWGLSDDLDEPKWTLAEGTTLEPGGHLVLWLDDEVDEGDDHAPFTLDAESDEIALFGPESAGSPLVDGWSFEAVPEDVGLGRFPDGAAFIAPSLRITPWNSNPHDPGQELDPSTALFPDDEVLEIRLWIPDEGIDGLKSDPYTEVEAALAFEGSWFWPVGVRIKGQAGSLRSITAKAALRVSLDSYVEGAELRGLENLTLNNMVQDASFFHERTAYALLREGGAPAPRNAYTALYVNDEYKGLYLNLETQDDNFLARWFGSDEGNLYEGEYGQDFPNGGYASLDVDQQGSEDVDDLSDLAALAALLEQDPSEDLVDDLEAIVDVDTTLAVLAGEVVTGHWDGYFYYPNNYRIYHDPSTGRFTLLAWGMDQTFGYNGSISAPAGDLASWMLEIPSLEQRWWLALWNMSDASRDIDVETDAEDVKALITEYVETDPFYGYGTDTTDYYIDATVVQFRYWPEAIIDLIFPDGEPSYE